MHKDSLVQLTCGNLLSLGNFSSYKGGDKKLLLFLLVSASLTMGKQVRQYKGLEKFYTG